MRDKTPLPAWELSPATAADWEPLADKFLRLLILRRCAMFALAVGAWVIVTTQIEIFVPVWIGLIPLGLGFAMSIMHAAASLAHMGYALRHTELLFRQGVWWRELTVVPFNRIQHVETFQGPLERSLGLASLSVYTAGSGGGDVQVPGLAHEDAKRIRDQLLSQLNTNE